MISHYRGTLILASISSVIIKIHSLTRIIILPPMLPPMMIMSWSFSEKLGSRFKAMATFVKGASATNVISPMNKMNHVLWQELTEQTKTVDHSKNSSANKSQLHPTFSHWMKENRSAARKHQFTWKLICKTYESNGSMLRLKFTQIYWCLPNFSRIIVARWNLAQ